MKKLLVLATLIAGVMIVGCSKEEGGEVASDPNKPTSEASAERGGAGAATVQEGPGAADAASRVGSKSGN